MKKKISPQIDLQISVCWSWKFYSNSSKLTNNFYLKPIMMYHLWIQYYMYLKNGSWLTTGSRYPNIAPNKSILPILACTGRAAKWWPSGVRLATPLQAPISYNRLMALAITWGLGGSRHSDKKLSGSPRSHFCKIQLNLK